MMPRISDTAKSIGWLLENDPKGWCSSLHSMGHAGSGIGIWIANGIFFCNPFVDVPREDIQRWAHILGGREVHMKIVDKLYIWMAVKRWRKLNGPKPPVDKIPDIISEFAEKKFDKERVQL